MLAEEVTRLVHGADGLESAVRITDALFSGAHHLLSEQDLMQLLLDGIPSSVLGSDALQKPLTGILVDAGLASSGKQAKDALSNSALLINGLVTNMEDNMAAPRCFAVARAMYGRFFLARLGKRSYHLFVLV